MRHKHLLYSICTKLQFRDGKATMTTVYFRRWAAGLKVEKHGQCSGSAWRTAPLVVIIVLMFRLFLHLSLKCLYFSHAALKDQEPKVYKFKEVNTSRLLPKALPGSDIQQPCPGSVLWDSLLVMFVNSHYVLCLEDSRFHPAQWPFSIMPIIMIKA